MKKLLSGKEIIKSYGVGEEKQGVLNGVSVEIESGEFVSIMGPSGSGKSTLLYALSGMDDIDSGEVTFDGQNLSGLTEDALSDLRRSRMGFVFQQPTLLKNLNILDNILLPQTRDHHRNVKELTEKARRLMKQMGIEELEQEIKRLFYRGELKFNDQVYITNVRHKEALEQTLRSLMMVKRSIEDCMPEDFYSIDLMDAYEQLGLITGEAVDDDLVNEIFARFCMGK